MAARKRITPTLSARRWAARAVTRLIQSVSVGPDFTCDEIMVDHYSELVDHAGALAAPEGEYAAETFEASAAWANRMCAALRSTARFERMSAELALRIVHLQLRRTHAPRQQ